MENIVLKMHYKVHFVEVLVEDTDRTLLMDVYNEMLDEVEAENIEWPTNPSLTYSYQSRSVLVREDCDLMEMFNRLGSKKTIDIWIGEDDEPCHVLVMAREVRSYSAKDKVEVLEVNLEKEKQGQRREKIPFRRSLSNSPPKCVLKPVVEAANLGNFEQGRSSNENNNVEVVENPLEKEGQRRKTEKLPVKRSVSKGFVEAKALVIAEPPPPKSVVISPRRSPRFNKSQATQSSQPTSPIVVSEKVVVSEVNEVVEACDGPIISPRRSGRLNRSHFTDSTSPVAVHEHVLESDHPTEDVVNVERSNRPQISPKRSGRLNKSQVSQSIPTSFKAPKSKVSQFKLPRTSALRKGLYVPKDNLDLVVVEESNKRVTRSSRSSGFMASQPSTSTTQIGSQPSDEDSDQTDGSYEPSDDEQIDEEEDVSDLEKEDHAVISTLQFIDDDYNPYEEHGWMDDEDGGYNAKLFKNGELYENKVFGAIRLKPWQIFMDKDHFKDVLRDFCVQEGFKLVVIKAEWNRYTATCATSNCGWRIHASVLPDGQTWAIKSIQNPEHGCDGVRNNNPMANCKWVAKKLIEDIRANHAITAQSCNDLLMKRYGLNMPNSSVYKMKEIALTEINGGHDESYRLLTQYCEMIKLTNPGSVALASGSVNQDGVLQFKSIFIAFHAQIVGLMRGCRSLIGVDGAHLKGNYGGVLLSAVALDGNNEIYPVAVAIVDSENKDSWTSFFRQLKQIIIQSGRDDWTIISDRQKGVEPALEAVWPEAYRRFCCRHLCKNFKQDYPGLLMHGLFWKVVNATSEFSFKKALESVAQHGGIGAARWFLDLGDKEAWAKHRFNPNLSCEDNTSNFVESFNATLGVHRCNPALSMLEGIRRMSMVRNASRAAAADTWPDDGICPNIITRLKTLQRDSRFCQSFTSGNGEFEVRDGGSVLTVNLNLRTCLCGGWQISGIPCKHALRAILDAGREPSDYVSEWFSVKRYREVYGLNIHPIPDSSHWQTFNVPTLEPPELKRSIGRPSRNRRREPGEQRKGKRSIVITCKKCGCMGHNSKTCKGGYTAKQKGQLQGKFITKRQKTNSKPTTSRINATSLNDLEALIMGTQTTSSLNPTPASQGQSSQSQPSTSQGPQKRGRKRKEPPTSK